MATHKELITAGKFDEKFKRALLDYYGYGFKREEDFAQSQSKKTIRDDWERLNRVISDYMEWSDWDERKSVMFASVDSQSMEGNPFHKVYRFCKYKPLLYPAYFLHTMAALSNKIDLRDGVESLELDDDQRIHLEDVLESNERLKTSDLICFYTEALVASEGDDRNKTPNNRLDDMLFMGLVDCEQYKPKGDRRWSLPELNMCKILDEGAKIDDEFEIHLCSALDFFSKYFIFGEMGIFLKGRISNNDISPFRFKHEYFMQSLNDFNIVDILYAIERKKWCKIKYRHGTAGLEAEILCFPLEIRISSMQGREFLMYYEPFHRSYTSLRIEFIESIELFEDANVKQILIQKGYHKSFETVEADIKNSTEGLKYLWGVSTSKDQENNAVQPIVAQNISLQLLCDENTDYYIINRLNRERRSGIVTNEIGADLYTYSVDVSDSVEMRPWLRSFYSRIISCDGMDSDSFSLETDAEKIVGLLLDNKLEPAERDSKKTKFSAWSIPETVAPLLKNGEKAKEHDLLFNEIFSIYYSIMADVFIQICSGADDVVYSDKDIDDAIENAFNNYYLHIGEDTEDILPEEIKELLKFGAFLKETEKIIPGEYDLVKNSSGGYNKKQKTEKVYAPKYKCAPDLNMYKDIVPLSIMEIRWLKTIINCGDGRINQFMSEEEIKVIADLLNTYYPTLTSLPIDKIVYYDRFCFNGKNIEREAYVLNTIISSIYNHSTIQIKYHTMRKRVKYGEFKPIIIEFSKRNNRFQGFFQECNSDKIYTMNISRIENAVETGNAFDYEEAEQAYNCFRNEDIMSVELEFYDTRNIADRILTEFSPWKKKCIYDSKTHLFRLTIYYQKKDEMDLVIRLLGYGGNLRFVDKEHSIYKEIQLRMYRQMELIRDQRNKNKKEQGDDNR